MGIADWIVFLALSTGLISLGWYCHRYMRSVADFVVAGRKMGKYLGMSSWTAEGIGLISIVYLGEQGFQNGLGYVWMILLNLAFCVPLFGIFGFGIRRFRATRAQTIPQFHEMRFSKGVRMWVGVALALGGILNMAVFPSISSRFFTVFLGLPSEFALLGLHWNTVYLFMLILIIPSLFIALVGGAVGVIVTDYLQSIILAVFIFLATGLVFYKVGFPRMNEVLRQHIGPSAFNPFLSGAYGPVWVAFFVLSGILGPLSFPPTTTKFSSADSPRTTLPMALIGYLFNSGRAVMMLVWGVGALAIMGATPPAGIAGTEYARYATAVFLREISPVGMVGLCAAGLLFAYIATDKNYYLSWSAIIVNDVIRPLRKDPLSTKEQIWLLRGVMVLIAAFLFFWGIVYTPQMSVLAYVYLTGAIFTAAGIITVVGLYWKRANVWGAYLTVLICIMIPIADILGRKIIGDRYPLKAQESGLLALLLSFAAFFVCGVISRRGESKWVDYGKVAREEDVLLFQPHASR